MKKIFLLSLSLILWACIKAQQSSRLPDWAIGAFMRPLSVPVIVPDSNATFFDSLRNENVHWQANATFNPAAIVKDNKIIVLFRAEDALGANRIGGHTSRIGYAESVDGIHMKRSKTPVLYPRNDAQKGYDFPGGCEDPRVAQTEDGTYVLFYTSWNGKVPRLAIATSKDLKHWTKHGSAFAKAWNGKFANTASKSASIVTKIKNGKQVIAKVNGKYLMYWGESFVNLATSDDLINWTPMLDSSGSLLKLIQPRRGYFDSKLTECGPPAIITNKGILLLYNGKNDEGQNGDTSFPGGSYCAGQVLFNLQHPTQVIARLDKPFLYPTEAYERTGQYAAGTVFIEGMAYFRNKWFLYYGCADSRVGVAVTDVQQQ